MKNKILEPVLNKEEAVIGNLRDQFIKKSLRSQRYVQISPNLVSGNITLAYYRGLAEGRSDAVQACIGILKKSFPDASKLLKEKLI